MFIASTVLQLGGALPVVGVLLALLLVVVATVALRDRGDAVPKSERVACPRCGHRSDGAVGACPECGHEF